MALSQNTHVYMETVEETSVSYTHLDVYKRQPQMRLTNLEFGKYTNMSEKERQDYADAWLYIHRKKEK